MGRPVWTMIAEPPDLRWLVGRDDSPWYPTMRLFRQAAPGDWAGVVARVARELARGPAAWSDSAGRPGARVARARDALPPEASRECVTGMADLAETRQGLLMFDADDSRVGRSIRHYGEWLHGRLELALRLVSPGGVIVEAGAGIGCHAVALGRALGADGRLLLYERSARRARMLQQNLAANRIANATTVIGELGDSRAPDADARRDRVDDFALERCDGIKVGEDADAEAVLEGAQQTLWRCRPWLMLAADDEAALGRLAARVRTFGYRAFRCATMLHAASNFYERDDDVFDGASALALVALPEEADVREALPGCVELA